MKKSEKSAAVKNMEMLKRERELLEKELAKRQDEYYALLKRYGKKPVFYAPDIDLAEEGFGLDDSQKEKLSRLTQKHKKAERKLFPSDAAYDRYSLYLASYDDAGNFTYASDAKGSTSQYMKTTSLKRKEAKREKRAQEFRERERDELLRREAAEADRITQQRAKEAKQISGQYKKSGDPSPAHPQHPTMSKGKSAFYGDFEIKIPASMKRRRDRLIRAREKLNRKATAAVTEKKVKKISSESRLLAKYEAKYRADEEKYLRRRAKKLAKKAR